MFHKNQKDSGQAIDIKTKAGIFMRSKRMGWKLKCKEQKEDFTNIWFSFQPIKGENKMQEKENFTSIYFFLTPCCAEDRASTFQSTTNSSDHSCLCSARLPSRKSQQKLKWTRQKQTVKGKIHIQVVMESLQIFHSLLNYWIPSSNKNMNLTNGKTHVN